MDVSLDTSRAAAARSPFAVLPSRLRHYQLPLYFVAYFTITWPLQVLVVRTGVHFDLNPGPSVLVSLAVAGCGLSLAAIAVTALLLGWGGVPRLRQQACSWRMHPTPGLLVDGGPQRTGGLQQAPGRTGLHDPAQRVKDCAPRVAPMAGVLGQQRQVGHHQCPFIVMDIRRVGLTGWMGALAPSYHPLDCSS